MQVESLLERARGRIIAHNLDLESALDQVFDESIESGILPSDPSLEASLRSSLKLSLSGFGQLQPFLDDPEIEEIWINSESEIFVAKNGVALKVGVEIPQVQLATIVEKMLRHTGRRLDRSSPFVDASLPDGSRLHVVIPDITRKFWSVNIRKFPKSILTLDDLVLRGAMESPMARFLAEEVRAGKNFLISGATQSGKTTLLCALLNEVAYQERIVTVEETFEIRVEGCDWVAMQTRQPNLEGVGEISLRRLVKESLRMRPGRIVVGEVREAESFDLLIALNSGLPGMCTIHANSASDAITKLCTLPLLAGQNITSDFVNITVGSSIDYVVHCRMDVSGMRAIEEVKSVRYNRASMEIELNRVFA